MRCVNIEHALALLARAKGDLYVLRRLRDDPDAPAWVLGFHAQQAVEKKASKRCCPGASYRTRVPTAW
jgi:hypothetical protein